MKILMFLVQHFVFVWYMFSVVFKIFPFCSVFTVICLFIYFWIHISLFTPLLLNNLIFLMLYPFVVFMSITRNSFCFHTALNDVIKIVLLKLKLFKIFENKSNWQNSYILYNSNSYWQNDFYNITKCIYYRSNL